MKIRITLPAPAEPARSDAALPTSTPSCGFIATAEYHGMRYSVSWIIEPARFHVWLNEDGSLMAPFTHEQPVLYKNSIAAYRTPGHFDCRKLNPNAAANREMIAAAIAQVDLAAAKSQYEAKEAQKEADRLDEITKREAQERLHQAAPALADALAGLLNMLDAGIVSSPDAPLRDFWKLEEVIAARAALALLPK